MACFPTAPLFDTLAEERCGVNVVYTPLKSTWATISSLTIQVYLHSFSRCWL